MIAWIVKNGIVQLIKNIIFKVFIESLLALTKKIDWVAVGERMWTRLYFLAADKIASKSSNTFSLDDAQKAKDALKGKKLKVADECWE